MDILGIQKDVTAIQNAASSVESQTAKDAGALVSATFNALNTLVGEALADATAERVEFVNDIHGILDRFNGSELALVNGAFKLIIPQRIQPEAETKGTK